MGGATDDNEPAFDKFLLGYWNQMADELYETLRDALEDFKVTEGDQLYRRLVSDIIKLYDAGRFPLSTQLRAAHNDESWSTYDRIIAREEVELALTKLHHPI